MRALSFSAWNGTDLVGTLQSWPVAWVDAHSAHRRVALVMVGPVAVRPDMQLGGIGRMLMDQMIAAADTGADGALMMIGDPDYYGRFWGFAAEATMAWEVPGPVERHRLLAREVPGRRVPAGPGMIVPDPERRCMQAPRHSACGR